MLRHPVPHQGTNCSHALLLHCTKTAQHSIKGGASQRSFRPALQAGGLSQQHAGSDTPLSAAADRGGESPLAPLCEGLVEQAPVDPLQQQHRRQAAQHQQQHGNGTSDGPPDARPQQPAITAAWLSTSFHLNQRQADKLAQRVERGGAASVPDAWRALQALSAPAGVDPADLVRADALLLALPAEQLRGNCAGNAAALRVSEPELVLAARRHPAVLRLPADELQARLEGLSTLLDCPLPRTQQLAVQHPALVGAPAAAVRAKLSHLQAALDMPFCRLVEVVITNPLALARSTRHVDELVAAATRHMSLRQLALAVRRDPWLLNIAPRTLPHRLQHLQHLLGVPPEAAVSMVVRRPALLRRAPETIQRAFNTLRFLSYPREYLVEVVKAHPVLLRLAPAALRSRCLFLAELLRHSPWYRHQAARLPAPLLGVLLMHVEAAADALGFLADARSEGALSLLDALHHRRRAALPALFPQYAAWLQWRAAGGKAHARHMLRLHLGLHDSKQAPAGEQQAGELPGSSGAPSTASSTSSADTATSGQEYRTSMAERAASHAGASTSVPSCGVGPAPAGSASTAEAAAPLLRQLDDLPPSPLEPPPPPDPLLPSPQPPRPSPRQQQPGGPALVRPRRRPQAPELPPPRIAFSPQSARPSTPSAPQEPPPALSPRPSTARRPPTGSSPQRQRSPTSQPHATTPTQNLTGFPPLSHAWPSPPTPAPTPTPAPHRPAASSGQADARARDTEAASPSGSASSPPDQQGSRRHRQQPKTQPGVSASGVEFSQRDPLLVLGSSSAWHGLPHLPPAATPPPLMVAEPLEELQVAAASAIGAGGASTSSRRGASVSGSSSGSSSTPRRLEAYQLQGRTIVLPPSQEHALAGPCNSGAPCGMHLAGDDREAEGGSGGGGGGSCCSPHGVAAAAAAAGGAGAVGARSPLGAGQCLPEPPLRHGVMSQVGLPSGGGGEGPAAVGSAAVVLQSS